VREAGSSDASLDALLEWRARARKWRAGCALAGGVALRRRAGAAAAPDVHIPVQRRRCPTCLSSGVRRRSGRRCWPYADLPRLSPQVRKARVNMPRVTAAHRLPGLVQGVGFRYSTAQEAKVRSSPLNLPGADNHLHRSGSSCAAGCATRATAPSRARRRAQPASCRSCEPSVSCPTPRLCLLTLSRHSRAFLNKGPSGARVDKADVREREGDEHLPSGFEVRH
jgi:hypothetical protein